jgi:hypothetical protein
MADDGRRHLYLNPVRAERADDFAAWLRRTLMPAVEQARPQLVPRAQTWRATEPADGVVMFAFLLDGGDPAEWSIDPLLRDALGDRAADAAALEWAEMLAGPQVGGVFRPLD